MKIKDGFLKPKILRRFNRLKIKNICSGVDTQQNLVFAKKTKEKQVEKNFFF